MEKIIDFNRVKSPETLENKGKIGYNREVENMENINVVDMVEVAFTELAAVRDQIKKLDALKKKYEDIIKSAMDADCIETMERNGYKAYYQPIASNKWDTDRLKADHPEIYNTYYIQGSAIRFQFRKVK